MKQLLWIVFLLLISCSSTLPAGQVDEVKLSDDLKAVLPEGARVDFGNGVTYTRLNDSVAVRTRPAPMRKCKNCYNTDNSDNSKDLSKDKSKEKLKEKDKSTVKGKDKSGTTIKDKSDNSELKGAKYDNRIQSAEDYSTWFKELVTKIVLIILAGAVVLFLIRRYLL